jgi:hypothetical protein
MLGLRFFNETPPESSIIHGDSFLFIGDTIERKPHGDIVARHVQEWWLVGGNLFLKIECCDLVDCLFVGEVNQRRGPYHRLTVMDGVMAAGGTALAMLSETNQWRSLVGDEMWSRWELCEAATTEKA